MTYLHVAIPDKVLLNAINMMLLIAILVILDVLTKWFIIIDRYNRDTDRECSFYNTFRGIFFRAWQKGYLESREFREGLGQKTRAYALAVLMAIVVYLFPDFSYNGLKADETISFLIYLTVVVAECFSIAENLKEMGVKEASFLKDGILAVLSRFGVNKRVEQEVVKRTSEDTIERTVNTTSYEGGEGHHERD
jgi:hypothetical protein|nr:MAG TPA: holin [Caudoviricetes sp.]